MRRRGAGTARHTDDEGSVDPVGGEVALRCSAAVFRDTSVLLCRRLADEEPAWVLPGGTPFAGEGAAACAQREVKEETGLTVDLNRVAFVLETTSPDGAEHLIEIVFLGIARMGEVQPEQREPHLKPEFVELDRLPGLRLLPPLGGNLRGLVRHGLSSHMVTTETAAFLGNVWREPGVSLPVANATEARSEEASS